MKKSISALCVLFCLALTASEAIISHDILSLKPEVQCQEKGSVARLENGKYRFIMKPEGRDCWLRFPVKLDNLSIYDELEIGVDTENPKAAMVMELNSAKPENALALKKNIFMKPGAHSYTFWYPHTGIDVKPGLINFRMLNKQDNFHLPQSVMEKPVDFTFIKFNVTAKGIDKLKTEFERIYDTGRYAEPGRGAAEKVRDELKKQSDKLFAEVTGSKTAEPQKIAALKELHRMRQSAGWQIELAALQNSGKDLVTGWTGGADKVFRTRQLPGSFTVPVKVELARRETESAQIVLFSRKDLKDVTVKLSSLSDSAGHTIGVEQLSLFPVGYIKAPRKAYPADCENEWIPDPVLTETNSIDIEKDHYQPYWLDVKAEAGQQPGTYRGEAEFLAGGKSLVKVPLEVKVWNFELPEILNFPVIISSDLMSGKSNFVKNFTRDAKVIDEWDKYAFSPTGDKSALSPEARHLLEITEKSRAIYRDHNIPFADIYRSTGWVVPDWRRRLILEDSNLFCLGYDKSKNVIELLRPQAESMRKDGTAGKAYIYGYDEITNQRAFDGMKKSYAEVKKYFPEIITTAVALDYTYGELTGTTDTLDIWIVPPTEYLESREAAERARKRGKQVWWYPCNWPFPPDANLLVENTATATRLIIGFMPWKFGVEGFLYYSSTFWINSEEDDSFLGRWTIGGDIELLRYGVEEHANEYLLKNTASLNQWTTLNQEKPIPIIASASLDIDYFDADPKGKIEFEIRLNYQDKTNRNFIFPVTPGSNQKVRFEEKITPEKPVKSAYYGFRIANRNARVYFKEADLKQEGVSRVRRNNLKQAVSGGPLIPYINFNVFGSNGDGSFFYPGLSGILPTVRAKNLRDGREDYEYLFMLKQAVAEVREGRRTVPDRAAWLKKAEAALTVGDEICAALDTYTQDGIPLLQYRSIIGELLNQIGGQK